MTGQGSVSKGLVSQCHNEQSGSTYFVSTIYQQADACWSTVVVASIEVRSWLRLIKQHRPDPSRILRNYIRNTQNDAYEVHKLVAQMVTSQPQELWDSVGPAPMPPDGFSEITARAFEERWGEALSPEIRARFRKNTSRVASSPIPTPIDAYRAALNAAETGDTQTLDQCLQLGINVNLDFGNGLTLIYVACSEGHDQAIDVLIQYGANINAAFMGGTTPLVVALRECNWSAAARLLSQEGVDVGMVAGDDTALDWAVRHGCPQGIVEALLQKGADPNRIGATGQSPIQVARAESPGTLVELLQRYSGKE